VLIHPSAFSVGVIQPRHRRLPGSRSCPPPSRDGPPSTSCAADNTATLNRSGIRVSDVVRTRRSTVSGRFFGALGPALAVGRRASQFQYAGPDRPKTLPCLRAGEALGRRGGGGGAFQVKPLKWSGPCPYSETRQLVIGAPPMCCSTAGLSASASHGRTDRSARFCVNCAGRSRHRRG